MKQPSLRRAVLLAGLFLVGFQVSVASNPSLNASPRMLLMIFLILDMLFVVFGRVSRVNRPSQRELFSVPVSLSVFLAASLVSLGVIGLSGYSPLSELGLQEYGYGYGYGYGFPGLVSESPPQTPSTHSPPPGTPQLLQNAESHLAGSVAVHVLPASSAQINRDDSPLALSPTSSSILIPVKLYGVAPWTLAYSHTSLDGLVRVHSLAISADLATSYLSSSPRSNSYSHAHSNSNQNKNSVLNPQSPPEARRPRSVTHAISVSEPGVYSLLTIIDATGFKDSIPPANVTVLLAPEAVVEEGPDEREIDKDSTPLKARKKNKFGSFDTSLTLESTHCPSPKSTRIHFRVFGLPPLQLYYLRQIGDTETVVALDNIGASKSAYDESTGVPIFHSISVEIDAPLDISGTTHIYRIVRVSDAANNTVNYEAINDSFLRGGLNMAATNVITSPRTGDQVLLTVSSIPTVRFAHSCENVHVRHGMDDVVKMDLELKGSEPFAVTYRYSNKDGADDIHTLDVRQSGTLQFTQPGMYTLLSISESYCQGYILSPTSCVVSTRYPPTISISATPREETCVGTTGFEVELQITGELPFWVEYVEHFAGRATRRRITQILKQRYLLEVRPERAGEYRYEFVKLGDVNFPDGIPITHTTSFTQTIHPRSNAYWELPTRITQCLNESATLSLRVSGVKPWSVKYDVTHGSERKTFTFSNITEETVKVPTGTLESSGVWTWALATIIDGSGCSFELSTPDILIEVLNQRPLATLESSKDLFFLQGQTAVLPVRLEGVPPWTLVYSTPEGRRETVSWNERVEIRTGAVGDVTLLEVRDKFCSGGIGSRSVSSTKLIPKPRILVQQGSFDSYDKKRDEHILNPVCVNAAGSFDINLDGKPPFHVFYTLRHVSEPTTPSAKRVDSSYGETTTELSNAAGQFLAKIPLVTSLPGHHYYTFTKIQDENYHSGVKSPHIRFYQRVYSQPSAWFKTTELSQCINAQDRGVDIAFQGQAPFTLVIRVKPENQPPTLMTLQIDAKSSYTLNLPTLKVGTYIVGLVSVRDVIGCSRTLEPSASAPTEMKIFVSDIPRISSLSPASVCVGDPISFSMQGFPPFSISYRLDECPVATIAVDKHNLTVLPASPGVMQVTRICSRAGCCLELGPADSPAMVPLDNKSITRGVLITHVIHDLPKAIISSGQDITVDIREGNETFIPVTLVGTPPFSFTYTRRSIDTPYTPPSPSSSPPPSLKHKNKASSSSPFPENDYESFTITNILTSAHDIPTKLQGLFQVSAVYDRHCSYPKVLSSRVERVDRVLRGCGDDIGTEK